MNSRKREVALVASGVMLGAAIAGPAASAALTAQQSGQKIFVDGKQVQIEAYAINGNNYCKLRDIGKAVSFNVSYDPLTNTVQIDTTEAYEDENTAKTVALPTNGSQYVPQAGDRILCADGTEYQIKDVSRWDNNVFQEKPLGPLPTPTCDWSKFPTLKLPDPVVKHYNDKYGDDLFVRNVFELRRMIYTIYNALGNEPDAWRDGKPLAKIYTEIPLEYEAYTGTFWPWREREITDAVHAVPNVRYYVDAYDYYHNGIYQYTRYLLLTL